MGGHRSGIVDVKVNDHPSRLGGLVADVVTRVDQHRHTAELEEAVAVRHHPEGPLIPLAQTVHIRTGDQHAPQRRCRHGSSPCCNYPIQTSPGGATHRPPSTRRGCRTAQPSTTHTTAPHTDVHAHPAPGRRANSGHDRHTIRPLGRAAGRKRKSLFGRGIQCRLRDRLTPAHRLFDEVTAQTLNPHPTTTGLE